MDNLDRMMEAFAQQMAEEIAFREGVPVEDVEVHVVGGPPPDERPPFPECGHADCYLGWWLMGCYPRGPEVMNN